MSSDHRAPAVELIGITKRFPGVVANNDITFRVAPGTVHALVGENGAGKSTLVNTLYGMHQPDEGRIVIAGSEVTFRSPADAIGHGIGMVHQHFKLADNLTVLENVVAGAEPRRGWFLDRRAGAERIRELAARHHFDVDPDARVEALGVGARQRVEILKVLYRGARIVILDEPTAVLVPQEVDELLVGLRELASQGLTVIFISHKLDEVLRVADDVTVLRRGSTVGTVKATELSARDLATMMIGAELSAPDARIEVADAAPVLVVRDLSVAEAGRRSLDAVNLSIRPGEILGVAGVEGNGQSELIEAVMGIRPIASGSITLDRGGAGPGASAELTHLTTRARREMGIGYIPEDRSRQALLLDAPLWENRILGHQTIPPCAAGSRIDRVGARRDTQRIVDEFDVRTPNIDVTAGSLSGGNQQKLIVGREMSGAPRLVIAAHPTRGVDVGAQEAIWQLLRDAQRGGLAVLLVSADLDELVRLSTRLVVLLRGRITAEFDPDDVSLAELGAAMTGARGAA